MITFYVPSTGWGRRGHCIKDRGGTGNTKLVFILTELLKCCHFSPSKRPSDPLLHLFLFSWLPLTGKSFCLFFRKHDIYGIQYIRRPTDLAKEGSQKLVQRGWVLWTPGEWFRVRGGLKSLDWGSCGNQAEAFGSISRQWVLSWAGGEESSLGQTGSRIANGRCGTAEGDKEDNWDVIVVLPSRKGTLALSMMAVRKNRVHTSGAFQKTKLKVVLANWSKQHSVEISQCSLVNLSVLTWFIFWLILKQCTRYCFEHFTGINSLRHREHT